MACEACKQPVGNTELLKCAGCKMKYHHNCVNVTTAYYMGHLLELQRDWHCPRCSNITLRRIRSDDTPIRHNQQRSDDTNMSCDIGLDDSALHEAGHSNTTASLTDISMLLDTKLEAQRRAITMEFKNELSSTVTHLKAEFTTAINMLSQKQLQITNDIDAVNKRLQAIENENIDLRQELLSCKKERPESISTQLQDTVAQLRAELNDREQALLINDIELSGIPEHDNESLNHIVMTAAAKLGVQLEERDVVNVSRVGARRVLPSASAAVGAGGAPSSGGGSQHARPRPIVLRLSRRALRDDFLRNARVRRGFTTEDIGLPQRDTRRCYISERLTKLNRVLFAKARELRIRHNWKFVWTKEGQVLAKLTELSKTHRIRTETDLINIFRVESAEKDCA